jgi:type I restriction enzyme S subunit
MASINLIKVTETLSEGRFDAEYFHPKYHLLDSTLHSLENKTKLGTLSNFIKKGIFDISPKKYRTKGVPLIRTTQIKSLISNADNLIFIDREEHVRNQIKTELLSGDIVFTKIGAGIGDVAILNKHYANFNFSQNVAGASIKRDKINPYYLICFLNSYYGREQIMRYMMPSGQGKLELKDIKKIQIFRTELEDKIADIIIKAEYTANQSQILYKEATDLLEQELGLDKISFEKPNKFISNFSDVVNGGRISSYFFQPKFNQLDNLLINFETIQLRKLINHYSTGFAFPKKQILKEKTDAPLIKIANIKLMDLDISSSDFISNAGKIAGANETIKIGDILIGMSGSVGTSAVVREEKLAYINQRILRINSLGIIDPEYLALVINSLVGKMQFEKYGTGGVQVNISPRDMLNIKIPRLGVAEDKIADLIKKSFVAKNQSQQLLADAKARVEKLIEEAAN